MLRLGGKFLVEELKEEDDKVVMEEGEWSFWKLRSESVWYCGWSVGDGRGWEV